MSRYDIHIACSQLPRHIMSAAVLLFIFISLASSSLFSQKISKTSLTTEIKHIQGLLASRSLDSLKNIFSEARIFVDVDNVSNTYLSQSQTLRVVSDFITQHSPLGLSIITTKEFAISGIALGGVKSFRGEKPSFKLTLGFLLSKKGSWLINRISIR